MFLKRPFCPQRNVVCVGFPAINWQFSAFFPVLGFVGNFNAGGVRRVADRIPTPSARLLVNTTHTSAFQGVNQPRWNVRGDPLARPPCRANIALA